MSVESHDLGPVPNLTALSGYGDSYVVPGDEVYVVSEDTDYIYLNTGSNPPADGFNIIKAIFLPGVWQRRSSGGGAGALRFNTIAVGALGSGRLIDTSLAGLVDGTSLAWVESVKDTWRWDATSTLTADNITVVNPTANGVNPGRFIRLLQAAPEWMTIYGGASVSCVIDASNLTGLANDENDGLTATTPLLTDTERQRRMGENPIWSATEYHLRYISDVPSPQVVVIRNRTNRVAAIFLHSSMTNGQGQSTLFGPATMGTITAENYATNQPWEMICATIPVSWSTAGPAGSSLIDQRIRVTAGTAANIGGVCWAIKDLGGAAPNAKVRLNEPQVAFAGGFVNPLTISNNTFTPTAGDTFVVEKLTVIDRLLVDIITIASSGTSVILESLTATITGFGIPSALAWGCNFTSFGTQITNTSYLFYGCQFGTSFPNTAQISLNNCYNRTGNVSILTTSGAMTRHVSQGGAVRLGALRRSISTANVVWSINQLGCFDVVNTYPIQILDAVTLATGATLWGSGSTSTGLTAILMGRGTKIGTQNPAFPASFFYMVTATTGANNGAFITCDINIDTSPRCFIPAFDYLATQIFTAPRLLSAANLQATVALGGFGNNFFDPFTACEMGVG